MSLKCDQLERACGFLLLNEFDVFSYCCKSCTSEFDSGTELETHILLEHQNVKDVFESIFVSANEDSESAEPASDTEYECTAVETIGEEIEGEPTVLLKQKYELQLRNSANSEFLGVFVDDDHVPMVKNRAIEEMVDENHVQMVKNRAIEEMENKAIKCTDGTQCKIKNKPNTAKGSKIKSKRSKQQIKLENFKKLTKNLQLELRLDPRRYYCEMCPFDEVNFIRKTDLYRHLREHVTTKKSCPVCNETPFYLPLHMKKFHPEVDRKKCNFCGKQFKTVYKLEMHMTKHTAEKPYLCPHCGFVFKTKTTLAEHIKRMHDTGRTFPYSCAECDMQFALVSRFESHRSAIHNDDRPHICKFCGDRFGKVTNIQRHIAVRHTPTERSHLCQTCGDGFKSAEGLNKHIERMHNSGRIFFPYSCIECDLQFRLVSLFEKHRLEQHSDDKPHSCLECGFRCRRTWTLNRHKFTHGDRTLACRYCDKKFRTISVKRIHEQKVHADIYVKEKRKNKAAQQNNKAKEQANLEYHNDSKS